MKGIMVQHLIPVVQGQGQILAFEAIKVTSTVANLIRKGELSQIPGVISAMKNQGQSLDDSLQSLVESGYIEGVEAWQRASDPRRFSAYRPDMHGKGA
jgi:Tfp pilus assembly pilus retraction ATPase PilT